ncbi:MAG: von Willebrand factor type A domain-containing protein [Lachnospiraceae bacterium]|nr:von Willebrand factor type A domain-containing protein [Lachnospiraceae bacterium]
MNISQYVRADKTRIQRLEYYLSLGYSEKASELLAMLTYGNGDLKFLVDSLPEQNIMDALYAFFLEAPGEDPGSIIHNYYFKNRTFTDPGPMLGAGAGGGPMGFLGAIFKGKGAPVSKARGRAHIVEDAGCPLPVEEACIDEDICEEPPELMGDAMALSASAMGAGTMAAPAGAMMGMMMNGAPGMPAPVPVTPEPGLTELTATDSYENIEEKDAESVLTAPTSTFRMTTNTASTGVVLNQIREGRRVDLSQVRIEELLNYFSYEVDAPENEKFRISTELKELGDGRDMLFVHVGAASERREKQNIVILLDVSGSMGSQATVTQPALATIVSKLKAGDCLSLITYSSQDETVYAGMKIAGDGDKEDIMGRILGIEITGCTNGSAGIETAYKTGGENYIKDGNNQVILITDGDLNFGITKKDGLRDLIEEKKKSNLFLSVIGTGLYNYKDDKLEVLSKHGNGTYCVVNRLEDVERSLNRRYDSLTSIVAKDVKAQVEFNPKYVSKYRLLGYENRALKHADFTNDAVISEPYGSGGYGVALYELFMGDASKEEQPLKYQTAVLTDTEEIATVKVRFKEPLEDTSTEISKAVGTECNGGGNLMLARFIYCLGEKLRGSDKLSADGEAFYKSMTDGDEYMTLPGENGEVLKMLVQYISNLK